MASLAKVVKSSDDPPRSLEVQGILGRREEPNTIAVAMVWLSPIENQHEASGLLGSKNVHLVECCEIHASQPFLRCGR